MSKNEVWKDVKGYEGLYKVSDRGNVFSVERTSTNNRKFGGITLKPSYDKDGYLMVNLYKNGVIKTKKIHRLVTEAFIPNPESHPEVNHRDEVKTNNYVENLEWCTREHNLNYGTRNERSSRTNSKKVKAVNIKTGEVLTFNSTVEAERKGYSRGCVASACRGDYNDGRGKLIGDGHTYRGYRWSYI